MILQALRSAIFYILFFLVTLVLATLVTLGLLLPPYSRKIAFAIATFWTRVQEFLLRFIVGIRTRVEGLENLPDGPCIIASKHQSDWDTIALYRRLSQPAFIAKSELFKIPLLGTTLRLMDIISIDRKRKGGSLPGLLEQGKATIEKGRRIFIFPEGTRKAPLAPTNYRFGVAKLYEHLGVPVVPVALNSGLFWGRNSLILWPGTATARILEPIPPGMDAAKMHEEMTRMIEKASTTLILEEVDKGLTRPITPGLAGRIAQARAEQAG